MAIKTNESVVRTEGLMTAQVDQGLVILNLQENNYVFLDNIGKRIWELIESPISVDTLCHRLEAEYRGDREQIIADLQDFLSKLERDDLVNISET